MPTVTSSSGATYVPGIASGLDTSALIEAAVAAKLKKSDRIDDVISKQTYQVSAYSQLQRSAQAAQDAIEKLKSVTSGSNAFTDKQVTTKSSNSTAAENILSATASSSARFGSYKVVVSQLAAAMSVNGATQSSQSAALGYSGAFRLGADGYAGADITITAGMSLQDMAAAINAVSASTGVAADIMRTGSGYTLVLTATDTATNFSVTDTNGVLAQLGIVDSAGDFTTIAQKPQPAIITLNGTTITSQSNTLEDVLVGVTIQLDNAAPDTTITIDVGNNTDGVKEAVQEFITAYNGLRTYLDQFQQVDAAGNHASYAYLVGDVTTRSMTSSLASLLSVSYGTGDYNSLGALGITLNSSNQLVLDEKTFDMALEADFDAVASFFASSGDQTGFADAMHTLLGQYANTDNGALQNRITALEADNLDLTARSDYIKEQATTYEQTLIIRYSNMETKIKLAEILKAQIEAILNGSTNND